MAYLFAIYIDSLVERVQAYGYGCYLRNICINIIYCTLMMSYY